MSWFYEALQRAEKERPKSGNGSRSRSTGPKDESLLAPIESLPSIADANSRPPSEPSSLGSLSSAENPPVDSAPFIRQLQRRHDGSNGAFRRLTLPIRRDSRLVFQTDPNGMPAEQFRLLRRMLKQDFPKGASLLITSPAEGDGKTLVSVNLSACLATLGDEALIVEADIRRPTWRNTWAQTIKPPGIEDAWAGKVEPAQTVHVIEGLSLHAAPVARIPENPSHLVSASGVRQFLAWARENFRWVVVDAPPILPAADVTELLPLVDAALLVIRAQSTPRELSKRALDMLGTRLHGIVLNGATVDSSPYYGYLSPYHQAPGSDKVSPPKS
jgi:capsular exopolysaccharide synthesis family protein